MILTATYKGGSHGHGHAPAVKDTIAGAEKGSKSFAVAVEGIYKQYGWQGFFMGLQARLAHVASIITSQLVLYDIVKVALGLPVTGSH